MNSGICYPLSNSPKKDGRNHPEKVTDNSQWATPLDNVNRQKETALNGRKTIASGQRPWTN